jgi:hypothetical protein
MFVSCVARAGTECACSVTVDLLKSLATSALGVVEPMGSHGRTTHLPWMVPAAAVQQLPPAPTPAQQQQQ